MVYFKIRFPREKSETNKLLISCIVTSLFKNLEMRYIMLNFVMKTLEFKVFLKNEETIYDINNLFVPPRFLARKPYLEIYHLVIALFSMPSIVFTPLLCKAKVLLLTNFFREPSSSRT